jgi:two-component system cell cycle response regulator
MARKYNSATRSSGYTVLVIDDSAEILESSRRLLEAEGHKVLTAVDGNAGLEALEQERVHLILCDYFMPEMTGEEVVRRVREKNRLVQIILVTGYSGEKPARVMMRELDIQGYHDKGEGADRLLLWVDAALKSYKHVLAMEKHRTGLRFILDITPELHRVQPMDELLRGLLWQIEGLLGAENSFLATFSPESNFPGGDIAPIGEGFVALVDAQSQGDLAIRFGTGRFHSGLMLEAGDDLDPDTIRKAIDTGVVQVLENASIVPLMLGKRPLGVIYLDRRTGHGRDEELLEVFASQAAAAIQNSLLYDLATVDSLTGTYVRGFVIQQLQHSIKRTQRHNDPLSVLMVDLDQFKQINDTYGHQVGDRALKLVGDLLREAVRETDVVGRYGGDEFIIILPGTPAAGALIVANRIMQRVANSSLEESGVSVPVKLSLGIATLQPPEPDADLSLDADSVEAASEGLIASADRALYSAKGLGRPDDPKTLAWQELLVMAAAD